MRKPATTNILERFIFTAISLMLFLYFPQVLKAEPIKANIIVRMATEKALKNLNSPMLEVIAQGSWISNINYRDARFQQIITEGSDHDMRPFFRSLNISDDAALEMWKRLRSNVEMELKVLVDQGVISASDLNVIRQTINIYPPEQLMKGVQTSEEAVARFTKLGIFPNLAETGAKGSGGSYGDLLKFERQGYESTERSIVLFVDKGEVRASSADLNHMLEGNAPRTAEGLAKAAEDNFSNAMKAAKAGNLKDTRKYAKRAADFLKEAKRKLKAKPNANDAALKELQDKLDDLVKKLEEPEMKTALFSERVAAKTAEGAAAQKKALNEFSKTADDVEKVMAEAADDSLFLQKLGKIVEESGSPKAAALFRSLLEGTGKWAAARAQVRKALPALSDAAGKIGFLNALMAYWTIKDLPETYVKEGATKATARFSMSLASMAVPEIALGELVALIATTVAELAVDYVAGYGYQAVTSTQDCFDLIAGVYTVYGREAQILGGTKKCHEVKSVRELACDVYDKEDVAGYFEQTGKLDAKGIPSELRTLLACHAENASTRFDQESKTDKGVEEALIAKCTSPLISAWIQERGLAVEEVQALIHAIDKSELHIDYSTDDARIKAGGKGTALKVSVGLFPALGDLPDQIKAKSACPGGRSSKPYTYQNVTWKVDGTKVPGTSGTSLDLSFDKPGSKTVCAEWELEYGVLNMASTLAPAGLSGRIKKSGCVTINAAEEPEADKVTATITGPSKAKAPEKAETGKEISLSVDIKSKRDPKELECRWTLDGGYGSSGLNKDDKFQTIRFDRPGTYTIKVEVYDRSDQWKVSQIKSERLAEAIHKITIEPSVKDANIELKISGPTQVTVGDTINLSVEVIAEDRIKAKLKPPVWFVTRGGTIIIRDPDSEDPFDDMQTRESIGRGPKASYKTTKAGSYEFSINVYGEGVQGPVKSATSQKVMVQCRKKGKEDECEFEDAGKKAPLGVEIIADRSNANTGETVNLSAVATGGRPIYRFSWSGAAEGAGTTTRFVASAAKRTAMVEARDQDGKTAKATVSIAVDKPLIVMEGLKNTAVFGTSQELRVPLEPGNTVLWQSSPTVTFKALETSGPTNTVVFDQMGKVKIWAEISAKKGEVKEPVNASDPVEVTVSAPEGKIEFTPISQVTGGQVTAEVKTDVYLNPSQVRYVWIEPVSSNRDEITPGQIRFTVKDRTGIPVQVDVRATRSDDTVLSLKRTFDPDGKSGATEASKGEMDRTSGRKKEAAALMTKAKEAVAAGKLDDGITLTGQAAGMDPKNTEAAGLEKQWNSEKRTVTDATQKARLAADKENFPEADKELAAANRLHPKYPPVIEADTYVKAKKNAYAQKIAQSNAKFEQAKKEVHLGKLDEGEKSAAEAVRINDKNTEAAKYIEFVRKEKESTNRSVDVIKELVDDCKFTEVQNALIPLKNKYPYYPPVQQLDPLISDRYFKWQGKVRESLGAIQTANEQKEFSAALDLIAKARSEIKPDGVTIEQLNRQEAWAKQWKAQKDRQIALLASAGEKVKNFDYAGALKGFEEGFANGQNIYNGRETEYKEAGRLRDEAYLKNKRLNELIPWVRKTAEDREYIAPEVLRNYLKSADEAISLQPPNELLKKWRDQIVSRIEKTQADNDRLAQGRKHLDAAGGAERGYLTNESSMQARTFNWSEQVELQQQLYLNTAIEQYGLSLKYIPDGAIEKKIKELTAILDDRRKFLENYRQSVKLRAEADAVASQAYREPDYEKSLRLFDEAAGTYRKSLSLYRPGNAEMIERQIWNLDYSRHDRMVKKYWADGQVLEKRQKIIEAVAAYDKAIASFHQSVPEMDRMWIITHAQDLRNRITGAKNWRSDGEAKQKAGKIADAIASYRQSLKFLPDADLEEYVRMLEGRQAKAADKIARADRLWQEGTALINQGKAADALSKLKESLSYWQDATRVKYVSDLEARRSKAASLREEGAILQQQNLINVAIGKYRNSLTLWPDPALANHIATLEGRLKEESDVAARKTRAKQLRDEGYRFQQQNQFQAAIGKYRESNTVWPDKQLEDYIKQLETRFATPTPVKPSPVKPVPLKPAPTAAPAGSSGKTSFSWSGTWKSDPGPDSEVLALNFIQNGNHLTGTFQAEFPYTGAGGAKLKESYRGTLEGTIEPGNIHVKGSYRVGTDQKPTGTFDCYRQGNSNEFHLQTRDGNSFVNYTVRRTSR